jgi:uncharacterized protein involved in exopolysaccharide biosynthesis
MDTNDRSDPNVPGSSPGSPFLHPDWAHGSETGQPAGASSGIGRRSFMRELASRWRRILLFWVLVASPVAYVIYVFVEPTFEAVSLLRVEPRPINLYSPGRPEALKPEDDKPYVQTQIQLIRSDSVLNAALAKPGISNLPMVASSKDPMVDLREKLGVTIVGENTYLIRVALGSKDPNEAAAIVNAVVDAYLEQHNRYRHVSNRNLRNDLEGERAKLEKEIEMTVEKLGTLAAQGTAPVLMPQDAKPADKGQNEAVDSSLLAVTEPQFVEMTSRLLHADFELMDARARLETARLPKSQASAEKIRELESALEEVQRRRNSYARYIARIKVPSKSPDTQRLAMSLLTQDLHYFKHLHEVIKSRLAQIDFESDQAEFLITVQDKAGVPREPAKDRRLIYMAGVTGPLLFLVIGLSLLPIPARRADAPDAAS